MKLRRIFDGTTQQLEVLHADQWAPLAAGSHGAPLDDLIAMLRDNPVRAPSLSTPLLPFAPRSYRDFMLFQKHYEQAARGYARRFRPGVFPLTRAFESLTRMTFPKFLPPALWHRQPIYYMSNHLRFVTDGAEMPWPAYADALDYELELGFVLATPLRNATPTEALAAIGGFVVFNDFSARDTQIAEIASGFGPQKSKSFGNAMSSVIVSADEIVPHLDALTGRVIINGDTVAECSSRGMKYSLGEALAHVSQDELLEPGEFFGSGTLPNGAAMETGTWIKPGDIVRLELDRIGSLTNTVGARAIRTMLAKMPPPRAAISR